MKYITFYRENNKFEDILKDVTVKPSIGTKIQWLQHLMLGIDESTKNDHILSYISLKYGDDIAKSTIKDFTPIPYVDYTPKKNPSKFLAKINKA